SKPFFCVAVKSRKAIYGFSTVALMTISDDERHLLVSDDSVWLRRAGGDAGAMMLDAYRQILSETEPAVRTVMLEFLESVSIHYISS
ncbi:hypothetical protein ABKT86_23075, partial (plasmid) [Enterobacter hormaechei]